MSGGLFFVWEVGTVLIGPVWKERRDNIQGPEFTKQTYNNFYPKFFVKQSYNVFLEKNTLKKYDLQESYNNFNKRLKKSFVNRAPGYYLWFSDNQRPLEAYF